MGNTMNLKVSGSYNVETLEADSPPTIEGDIHYVFPEPDVFKGRPVIEILKELMQLVNGIIETFAAMVAARVVCGL
jgi:hypothetical protein